MKQEFDGCSYTQVVTHLPSPLVLAIASAHHKFNCMDLDMNARRALAGILHFVSIKNLKKAIFPRRETLLDVSHIGSLGSLYRGLKMLTDKGYITREQIRYGTGKFHISRITLTDKALLLLDLEKLIHNNPPHKLRDGSIYKERSKEDQSLQKASSGEESLNPIDKETHLPVVVLPLLQLDVKKPAICMLMKLAKQHGKLLSDVITVVWYNIHALRGREVVAYLSSLLVKDLDFEYRAKIIRQENQDEHHRNAWQDTLDNLNDKFDGYHVYSADNEFIGVFEYIGQGSGAGVQVESLTTHNGRQISKYATMPVNLEFAKRFKEGEFRIVQPQTYRHSLSS